MSGSIQRPAQRSAQRDGLLLIDKPADMTSHDVVGQVRKALGQKSVGHTGTLDPLATGLMILVLGDATKLSDYLITADKSYSVTVQLGLTTDSLDRTGRVLSETPCHHSVETVRTAAEAQTGQFQWPIPLFSAAKIDGKKLYEYGHKGEVIALPSKLMEFWDIDVVEASTNSLQVTLSCSKGSFIRTWADQLGRTLGVGGVVGELRRLRVGSWNIDQAIRLDQMATLDESAAFVPMNAALPSWKSVMVNEKESRLLGNGQIPKDLANRLVITQKDAFETQKPVFVKIVSNDGELLAILAAEAGQGLKIRRVFRSNA